MGLHSSDYARVYAQSLGFANVTTGNRSFAVDGTRRTTPYYTGGTIRSLVHGRVDDSDDGGGDRPSNGHSYPGQPGPPLRLHSQGCAIGEGFGDYWAGPVNATLTAATMKPASPSVDAVSYASGVPQLPCQSLQHQALPDNVAGEVTRRRYVVRFALADPGTALARPRATR